MTAKVLIFGPFADAAGARTLEVCLPETDRVTASVVMAQVAEQHPALRALLRHAMLAVNCSKADDTTVVRPGDELAIIGLVSGG